jgi:hypothetical protein
MEEPMAVSVERAEQIIRAHGHDVRLSTKPGHIEALAIEVDRAGVVYETWEAVRLDTQAIRDWLGY